MTRRMVASGTAVLLLVLGGSTVAQLRHPAHAQAPPVALSRVPVSAPDPPAPIPAPVPPTFRGAGPDGSLRTTGTVAVALTFDDGPFPYTAQVLDLLAQYHVKATFCLIGRQVAAYAAVVRRMVAEGHTICNHTWDHDLFLHTRSADRIRAELQQTSDAIHAVAPQATIRYFRCPGGNWSPQIVDIAAGMGMSSIHWSVDPQDWKRPGVEPIVGNVLSRTAPGSIVLMHDGGGDRSQTVVALRAILPNLVSRFHLLPLPV